MSPAEINRPVHSTLAARDLEIGLRFLTLDDDEALMKFSRALADHDLLFMREDITDPDAIHKWVRDMAVGNTITLVGERDGVIAGFASLHRENLRWSRHIGEIEVVLHPDFRGRGLGKLLLDEMLDLAQQMKLTKAIARMVAGQEGARKMFERMNFQVVAVLPEWVRDRRGAAQNLVILSRDV